MRFWFKWKKNFTQGIEGKYILARALTERYAPKEFMLDESLGKFTCIWNKKLYLGNRYTSYVKIFQLGCTKKYYKKRSSYEFHIIIVISISKTIVPHRWW